ncbi:MAG: hypothetical protein DMG12_27755 [Acidobacteria bacterium]|nr:MAG: hypothetical protein DMG12_27755 [Acidobacteriota bacterium]
MVTNAFTDHYRFAEGYSRVDLSSALFDPTEAVDNFRYERYANSSATNGNGSHMKRLLRSAYYLIRPALPVSVRKHLQRTALRGWEKLPWPDGYQACTIMTHDVETAAGRDFVPRLMDIEESFGIRSSFQLVPEQRYEVPKAYREDISARGFEVNIHGLNHDGHLFDERLEFERRARRINEYAREWAVLGFRSPVLYRKQEWFSALEFSYDMSVPNVAHLDPQRGGCCTVLPYFIGDILELPLTTTQDYSLFNIIGDFSIELWKRQMDLILQKSGLASFLIHPDYILGADTSRVFHSLLEYLTGICADRHVWCPLPKQVDAWWTQRNSMKLECRDGKWHVVGPGSERARVAYASLSGTDVVYQFEESQRSGATNG